MTRNLLARLERLERGSDAEVKGLPQRFWEALYGIFPTERLDSETREIVESLYVRPQNLADPVEYLIANPLLTDAEVERMCGSPPENDAYQ